MEAYFTQSFIWFYIKFEKPLRTPNERDVGKGF